MPDDTVSGAAALLPLKFDPSDPPIGSALIERFADGTFSVFVPLPDGNGMGLSRGALDGALDFAREQLSKD